MSLKRRNKISAEFSMSSLTDIIFLLLIFFMLTSSLVSPNALNLKLPSSNSQTVAPSSMSLSIERDGTFYVGTEKVSPSSLGSALADMVRSEAGTVEGATIIINAEVGTPIEHVVKAMDVANQLKLKAILATESE